MGSRQGSLWDTAWLWQSDHTVAMIMGTIPASYPSPKIRDMKTEKSRVGVWGRGEQDGGGGEQDGGSDQQCIVYKRKTVKNQAN